LSVVAVVSTQESQVLGESLREGGNPGRHRTISSDKGLRMPLVDERRDMRSGGGKQGRQTRNRRSVLKRGEKRTSRTGLREGKKKRKIHLN